MQTRGRFSQVQLPSGHRYDRFRVRPAGSAQKARFGDDDEVHATDIYSCKATDREGNWLSRFSPDVSEFKEIQRSTEVQIFRKALHPGLKLRDVFRSLGPDDLNVIFMTAPM